MLTFWAITRTRTHSIVFASDPQNNMHSSLLQINAWRTVWLEAAAGEHKCADVRVRPSLVSTEYFVSHIVIVLLHLTFPFDLLSVFKGSAVNFMLKQECCWGAPEKGEKERKFKPTFL